jgi:cytochrome c peroxidase
LGLFACGGQTAFPDDAELDALNGLFHEVTPPVDPTNQYADSTAARDLGAKLFSDARVSTCGTVSCQSCHPPPAYTVSSVKGHGCGGDTLRNPPTLLNSAFSQWFMWDGSKDTLWAQPMGPLLNPAEMAATPQHLRNLLETAYGDDYLATFGVRPEDDPDDDRLMANFGKAMEAYERTLIRVRSPFDQKLEHFLTSVAQGQEQEDPFYADLLVFVRRGRCVVCHSGPSLSDRQFHDLGLTEPSSVLDDGREAGASLAQADLFNSSGEYSDAPEAGNIHLGTISNEKGSLGAFKTPSLRNVGLTAPYMHNGSLATLEEVIAFYDRGGDGHGFAGIRTDTIIPLYLSDSEKAALLRVLGSLTGTETP